MNEMRIREGELGFIFQMYEPGKSIPLPEIHVFQSLTNLFRWVLANPKKIKWT